MLTEAEVLELWLNHSQIELDDKLQQLFKQRCEKLRNFPRPVLISALKSAKKKGDFKLDLIYKIALKINLRVLKKGRGAGNAGNVLPKPRPRTPQAPNDSALHKRIDDYAKTRDHNLPYRDS